MGYATSCPHTIATFHFEAVKNKWVNKSVSLILSSVDGIVIDHILNFLTTKKQTAKVLSAKFSKKMESPSCTVWRIQDRGQTVLI